MKYYTDDFDETDIKEAKTLSGFAYLGFTFFLPLLFIPRSKFGRFHANQALSILILLGAGMILSAALSYISISVFLSYGFWCVVYAAALVYDAYIALMLLLGMFAAFRGKTPLLPLIKRFSIIK